MKRFKNLILILCVSFSTSGYSTLKVGTLMFNPPFIVSVGLGFDIELTQLLCTQLKEQCDIIPMESKQLYKSLQDGQIDFAIGGIAISPLCSAQFIFSLPYMLNKGQFLITQDSKINSIVNLKGNTVGVVRDDINGGVFYDYLVTNFQGQFEIQQYERVEELLSALSAKTIAAAFLHRSTVSYWSSHGDNQFKQMGPIVIIGDGLAILALPINQKLITQINQTLKKMETDNTYLHLYNNYFAND